MRFNAFKTPEYFALKAVALAIDVNMIGPDGEMMVQFWNRGSELVVFANRHFNGLR